MRHTGAEKLWLTGLCGGSTRPLAVIYIEGFLYITSRERFG